MKLILTTFEQLSGLKINYHKSELYCFGDAKQMQDNYVGIFGCQVAETPFTYLGIPLHHKRISNKDWKVIEDRFERRLSTWKSKLLSYGGRLTLINSVLSNLSVRPGTEGLLIGIEYSRVRDSSWMYLTSFVTT